MSQPPNAPRNKHFWQQAAKNHPSRGKWTNTSLVRSKGKQPPFDAARPADTLSMPSPITPFRADLPLDANPPDTPETGVYQGGSFYPIDVNLPLPPTVPQPPAIVSSQSATSSMHQIVLTPPPTQMASQSPRLYHTLTAPLPSPTAFTPAAATPQPPPYQETKAKVAPLIQAPPQSPQIAATTAPLNYAPTQQQTTETYSYDYTTQQWVVPQQFPQQQLPAWQPTPTGGQYQMPHSTTVFPQPSTSQYVWPQGGVQVPPYQGGQHQMGQMGQQPAPIYMSATTTPAPTMETTPSASTSTSTTKTPSKNMHGEAHVGKDCPSTSSHHRAADLICAPPSHGAMSATKPIQDKDASTSSHGDDEEGEYDEHEKAKTEAQHKFEVATSRMKGKKFLETLRQTSKSSLRVHYYRPPYLQELLSQLFLDAKTNMAPGPDHWVYEYMYYYIPIYYTNIPLEPACLKRARNDIAAKVSNNPAFILGPEILVPTGELSRQMDLRHKKMEHYHHLQFIVADAIDEMPPRNSKVYARYRIPIRITYEEFRVFNDSQPEVVRTLRQWLRRYFAALKNKTLHCLNAFGFERETVPAIVKFQKEGSAMEARMQEKLLKRLSCIGAEREEAFGVTIQQYEFRSITSKPQPTPVVMNLEPDRWSMTLASFYPRGHKVLKELPKFVQKGQKKNEKGKVPVVLLRQITTDVNDDIYARPVLRYISSDETDDAIPTLVVAAKIASSPEVKRENDSPPSSSDADEATPAKQRKTTDN